MQEKLDREFSSVHKSRRKAIWRAVSSLLIGGMLWLSALGRHRPGGTAEKHSIKAIDRLLGNAILYVERKLIYGALARVLLPRLRSPIVLVDVVEIRPNVCAMSAALAFDGRAIPVYHIVRKKSYISKRQCRRTFLQGLAEVLPDGSKPVLVTDAGFQSTWLDEVEEMGWDYVARVRHGTKFLYGNEWRSAQELHKLAKGHARSLGKVAYPKQSPKERRLVLAKARKTKGRARLNSRKRRGKTSTDRRCRKSASEPWLLATTLECAADFVVGIYALRMQIEQNYRDQKNHRWGWALDQTRTRSQSRLEILLLIASLAYAIQLSIGWAGEQEKLHHRFQANTVRDRRVISLFVLGGRLLADANRHLLTVAAIRRAFGLFRDEIRSVERLRSP